MSYIIKDKEFYKKMLTFAIPIALQNMISTAAGIVDTVMLGKLGDVAVSSVSLSNQPAFLMQIICFGLSSGGVVLISQYWGKGNREVVPRIMTLAMRLSLAVSAVFTVVCAVFPEFVMGLLTDEAAVIQEGVSYLRVVCLGYVATLLVGCYTMSLRGAGKTKFSVLIYGTSTVVNVFFNYCFIFGNLGFSKLGVAGAAVATVISRLYELVFVTLYIVFVDKTVNFKWRHIFTAKAGKALTRDYMRYCLPVTGSETVWALGSVTTTAIIGHLGSVAVAANSVVGIVQQLAMVAMFGVGNATAIMSGNAVGAGDVKQAQRIGRTMLLVSVGVGIFGAGLVIAVRDFALSMYDISPEAKALARELMLVMAFVLIAAALEITTFTGVLRGAGDTKFAFFIDAGAMWLVGVPLGLLAGFVWGLPMLWVYILIRMDMPVRLALSLPRIIRNRYICNVTRDSI